MRLYFRFTLRLHDIEEMLAYRDADLSCETIRA
jgi:transposase-like protein